jgi:hypothetical protein
VCGGESKIEFLRATESHPSFRHHNELLFRVKAAMIGGLEG